MKCEVERFVFLSTRHVYNADGFIHETAPRQATSAYSASKLAAEASCEATNISRDIDVAVVRLFNMYGPGGASHQIVPEFIEAANLGEIVPKGKNTLLDLIHVDDVCRAIEAIVDNELSGPYNVGTGMPTSVNDLADTIAKRVSIDQEIDVSVSHLDQPDTHAIFVADIQKLLSETNWEPRISVDEGIAATVRSVV